MDHFLNNFKSQWSTLQTKLSADRDELSASSTTSADQQQQQTKEMSTEFGEQQHDMSDKIRPSKIANRVFGMAKKASSKLQEKATNISAIVNERTIIGNIEKERQKFMEELRKEGKCVGEIGLDGLLADVEAQQHIIAISSNAENLTEEPPLTFDLESDIALVKQHAEALFRLDPRLAELRFELVPKQVAEEKFWRNYAYRVSLVRKFVNEQSNAFASDVQQQQQQCSTAAAATTSAAGEVDDDSKRSSATSEQPKKQQSAESTETEEEKLLEKELLGDLNEFEMVADDEAGKKGNCGANNGQDENGAEDELLDKQLDELLDDDN